MNDTVGECSLGSILVAATDRGVCAVSFGDDPDALLHGLEHQFPRADLVGGDGAFDAANAIGRAWDPNGRCWT